MGGAAERRAARGRKNKTKTLAQFFRKKKQRT
jgi:hypothetical protein